MKLGRLRITVERVFTPMEVFGYDIRKASDGEVIPPCPFFKKGQVFEAENGFSRPEGFCGWAWRDLTVRLTKFDLIDDMDWPEEPMKQQDHAMDALRYGVMSLPPLRTVSEKLVPYNSFMAARQRAIAARKGKRVLSINKRGQVIGY